MSFVVTILIPVPQNTPFIDQQNADVPLNCLLPTLKEQKRQDAIIWKKSISAFRRYREKRERKGLGKGSQTYGNAQQYCQVQKQYVRLVRRSKKDMENDAQIQQFESPKSLPGYFDPNIAPLYQYNLSEALELNQKMVRESCSTKQMEAQYHQIKNQRIQSQLAEQFIPAEMAIQPRDDDPFFIIRRESTSKRETLKTKPIKKSEWQKIKGKGSGIPYSIHKGQRGQKQASLNLDQNFSGLIRKENQGMSDSEQEYQGQHWMGGKRQIETLQQILRLSQQNQQISHLPQQRETIIINESLEQKQKFQII